jgi:HKD family nuclease
MTRFGLSAGFAAARRAACHLRLNAGPPSMQASDEPIVEVPTAASGSGAFHSRARIFQHRSSITAVARYSSVSIMFLANASEYNLDASGSIQVPTNVARLSRALPSSIDSSCTI